MPHLRPISSALSTLLAAACGGGEGGTPDAALAPDCEEAKQHSDLAWIQDQIFDRSCTFSVCHDMTQPAASLRLTAGQARGELVGQAPDEPGAGGVLVAPGAPDQSYLMVAIGGVPGETPPSDGTMPLGLSLLCEEKLDAIRRWIEAGAPP